MISIIYPQVWHYTKLAGKFTNRNGHNYYCFNFFLIVPFINDKI